MRAGLLALAVLVATPQDDALLKAVERLRAATTASERKSAIESLVRLRKKDKDNFDDLRKIADAEKDPVVQARLLYALYGITLNPVWTKPVPGFAFPGALTANSAWVAVTGERNTDTGREMLAYLFRAGTGSSLDPSAVGEVFLKGRGFFTGDTLVLPATTKGKENLSRVWRVAGGKKAGIIWEGKAIEPINGIQCHPVEGKLAVMCVERGTLAAISSDSGKEAWRLPGIETSHFAATGSRLVYADGERRLVCADAADPKKVHWAGEAKSAYGSLGISGDRVIALLDFGGGELGAFDVKDGKPLWRMWPPLQLYGAVGWLCTSEHLVVGTKRKIHCFDTATGKNIWSRDRTTGSAFFILDAIEGCVAIGDASGFIVLDLNTGMPALDPDAPLEPVQSAAIDGKRLYVTVAGSLTAYGVSRP